MILSEAVSCAEERLRDAGFENSRWEAGVIASEISGVPLSRLLLCDDISFSPGEEEIFLSMVERRLKGEPLQYIAGNWDFYGRTFTVTPSTLIPRPETEYLVETILGFSTPPNPLILDAGTGSGVIGITLALEIPGATVIGTDISADAAELACSNGLQLGADRYLPVVCSLTAAVSGEFDIIAANLPYIPTGDIDSLPSVVRDYEPLEALDGGTDGTDFILKLIMEAPGLLKPGGLLALETGSDQEVSVPALFPEEEWTLVRTHRDLSGKHRLVTALRRV